MAMLEGKTMQAKDNHTDPKPREKFTVFYRMAMWLSIFLFHTLFPVRYHHAERVDMDAPFILIGNHNSMIDPAAHWLEGEALPVAVSG